MRLFYLRCSCQRGLEEVENSGEAQREVRRVSHSCKKKKEGETSPVCG